jgi:membrane protease YdiL (CAAX protease family)
LDCLNLVRQVTYITFITTSVVTFGAETNSPWSYETQSERADASDIALPLISFFLPGAGQWVRSQAVSGAAYSLAALGGTAYAVNASKDVQADELQDLDIATGNVAVRKYLLGLQTTQAAGGLSLYHAFRSAVWQRQKFGEYQFLGDGDTPKDILMAPFRFDYLTRSSTWIPLAIGGLANWYLISHPQSGYYRKPLRREDPWFAGGFSYNASTHEEALFRGWLMPVLHNAGMSMTMANISQASIFALSHLSSTSIPLPQFFLGLHLGSVTLRNSWTISESVFIHAWWDVFAFIGNYQLAKKSPNTSFIQSSQTKTMPSIPIMLPPLNVQF